MLVAYDRLIRDWQACLASVFFNGELDRLYRPPAHNNKSSSIKPGFTEQWGVASEDQESDGTTTTTTSNPYLIQSNNCHGCDHFPHVHVMDPEHPQHLTVLYQHRPAWAEQLVLRVAGLPHVVQNVSYGVSEVTGPLPYLLDSSSEQPTVLLGRHSHLEAWSNTTATTTSNTTASTSSSSSKSSKKHKAQAAKEKQQHWTDTGNAILDHLEQHHHKRVHLHFSKEPETQDPDHTFLLHSLIKERLPQCLTILRYKDSLAWHQIHRPQSLASYTTTTSGKLGLPKFASGLFQAWCERQFALNTLSNHAYRHGTVDWALAQIQEAYDILERHVEETVHKGGVRYILGTKHLTLTDALLWDHLMQAIVDVHLVGLLAHRYPHLCRYTEHIYELFQTAGFREQYKLQRQRNDAANATNVFVQGTLHDTLFGTTASSSLSEPKFTTALQLMQTMTVVKRQKEQHAKATSESNPTTDAPSLLQQQLALAAQQEAQQTAGAFSSTTTAPASASAPPPTTSAADEAAKRQHQRGDELWLAGTLVATVAAFGYVVLGGSNHKAGVGGIVAATR